MGRTVHDAKSRHLEAGQTTASQTHNPAPWAATVADWRLLHPDFRTFEVLLHQISAHAKTVKVLAMPALHPQLPVATWDQARTRIAILQARLSQNGLTLSEAPPAPTTCCGRGCNGCVWEGYFDAVAFWLEDAEALLAGKA